MSAHIFLNLSNKLRKQGDKMLGFAAHFISFCNKFDKLNVTGYTVGKLVLLH